MVVAETARLILRQLHVGDEAALEGVFCDAEVMRFGPGVQNAEWIRKWLKRRLAEYHDWGYGRWAIVEKGRRATIGYSGLTYLPDVCGQPETEIGYRLARAYWGHGFATEAAIAVRDYGFDTLGISRLVALIDPENAASIRVAEKIGMRHENDVMLEGYTHPDRVYSIARSDTRDQPAATIHGRANSCRKT